MKNICPNAALEPGQNTIKLPVEGMSCTGCAAGLQKKLMVVEGVTNASVNFALSQTEVDYESDKTNASIIREAVEQAGYQIPAQTISVNVGGMSCAGCAAGVEKKMLGVPGVVFAEVNLALEKAEISVTGAAVVDQVITELEAAGYTLSRIEEGEIDDQVKLEPKVWRLPGFHLIVSIILSAPMIIQMIVMFTGGNPFLAPWVEWLLATPVQFWIGARFYKGAWRVIRARTGNMDVLVTLGTSAAYFFSLYLWLSGADGHLYFESAAVVITLVLLGKWLESRAKRQALLCYEPIQHWYPLHWKLHELRAIKFVRTCSGRLLLT